MPELLDQIEILVDQHGLKQVLSKLSEMCTEKAAHVAENWQDDALEASWTEAAELIDTCSDDVEDLP